MAKVFVAAGVPLNVFNNTGVRGWLSANVKSGENLPSVSYLRNCLKDAALQDKEDSIDILRCVVDQIDPFLTHFVHC